MNIVITGASSGIGYHTALILSGNSENKIFAVSRSKEKLEKLSTEARMQNPQSNLIALQGDISDETSLNKISTEIKLKLSVVDVLINNAGLLINKPFEELTMNDWKSVYSTNVFGAVAMIRNLLPLMRKGSHVVNISSMGGFQGSVKFNGLSAYSSSKAALTCLTECLAEEFKEKGIFVNCLCLGSVQTEMFSEAFPAFKASSAAEAMASYVAQFATEGQNFFNGKIIPVSDSTP